MHYVRIPLVMVASVCLCNSTDAKQLAFQKQAIDQSSVEVGDDRASAVCFLGTECPMARSYARKLSRLQSDFAGRVNVIGVMSNVQDSLPEINEYASTLEAEFPIVHDQDGGLAAQYGATRTPEVFLVDSKGVLRYRGRVDDQFAPGIAKPRSTRNDLRIAIEQLLAGKRIAVPQTEALGCLIGRPHRLASDSATPDAPKYHEDVLPMLIRNCVECHRSGDIGPFAMDRYNEVVGWAETMLETIKDRRMPPWHADEKIGSFKNSRSISNADKQLLVDWIDAGMPEGDRLHSPELPKFATGWQLPQKPDHVFNMRDRPFVVPRDGVVEYQYFVVDPQFKKDVWVSAAEIIPGARQVVHHVIVFVRPPDGEGFRGIGWLAAYVPGQRGIQLPPGFARRIPGGSKLVFQLHYTPNGAESPDLTKIGLVEVAASEVTNEVYTLAALDQEFEIPPGAAHHEVSGQTRFLPQGTQLLAATPHMHLRGKSFFLEASGTKGTTQAILNVPRYDFNWQHTYHLTEPVPLDEFTELRFTASFDNSADNAFNPDPQQWVSWGDQSFQEMAVAFFEVAEPRMARRDSKKPRLSDSGSANELDLAAEEFAKRQAAELGREKRVDQYVARALKGLDVDQDGRITRAEGGIIFRSRFDQWDTNKDGVLQEDEVRAAAQKRYQAPSR